MTSLRFYMTVAAILRMKLALFVLLIYLVSKGDGENDGEAKLFGYLFSNYTSMVRPRINASEVVEISISFYLARLDEMEEIRQVMMTTGWLEVIWFDDFLKWSPDDYQGIRKVVVPANTVWLPDFALDNSAEDIYNEAFFELFRVTVFHTGKVMWEPGGKFSTACPLDVRYYPFDHQNCTVVFANWHYTKDQVNLSIADHRINMDAYETNAEWYVVGTSGYTDEFHANCCPKILYPEVVFTISMRRKYTYYIINILIPCAMMSLLILAVFFLPPDSGEKVSLGVTVLLAFSVFQLMIAESVPRSSGITPILEVYLLCFMSASTFSVIVSVFVLNLHHKTEYKPPPAWVRKLVLDWMAWLMFFGRRKSTVVAPIKVSSDSSMDASVKSQNKKKANSLRPEIKVIHANEHLLRTETLDSLDSGPQMPETPNHSYPNLSPGQVKTAAVKIMKSIVNLERTPSANSRSEFVPVIEENESPVELLQTTDSDFMPNYLEATPSSLQFMAPHMAKSAARIIKSIAQIEPSNRGTSSHNEFLKAIRDTYQELCAHRLEGEIEMALENEWKVIARVVDRFFFVVTTAFLIISSAVIFGILPNIPHQTDIW